MPTEPPEPDPAQPLLANLHAVIESATDAIITMDENRVIHLFNPAASHMYGIPQSEAIGTTIDRLIPQRFRADHLRHVHEFDQSEVPLRHVGQPRQIVGLRADGQEFPCEATVSQVTINGKKMFTVIVRDQTHRWLAEQALRDSEAFNVATLNAMEAEIAVLDHAGTIIAVNHSWQDFAQKNCLTDGSLPAQVQVGANYLAVCRKSQDHQAYEGIKSVIAGTSLGFGLTYPCNTSSGERWFHMSVTPMGTSDGKVVIAHTDITAQKLTEKALSASQETLRELLENQHRKKEQERSRVAQLIHDEIGTKLTAAKANLSFLMDQAKRSGADANPQLAQACTLLDSTFDTVRNVILDLRPSVLDNLGIWSALEWYCGQNARRAQVFCDFLIDPALEDHVPAPELSTALFRILQEALANIALHAKATEITVRVSPEQQFIKMEVEDNGIGIDLAKLQQIESWGIIDMTERTRYLGGSLTVTRTGQGTQLTVLLPLV